MSDEFTFTMSGTKLLTLIQAVESEASHYRRLNAGSSDTYRSLIRSAEELEAIAAELRDVLGWPKGGERATEAA